MFIKVVNNEITADQSRMKEENMFCRPYVDGIRGIVYNMCICDKHFINFNSI